MGHLSGELKERDLAEEYLRNGNFDAALALYERLAKTYPEDESIILALAWAHFDTGHIEAAIGCFEDLFEKESKRRIFTGFAYDELVRIYKTSRDYERLVRLCKRAVEVQPSDVLLLSELGNAYMGAGLPHQAASVFREILNKEPNDPAWCCSLGDALLAAGDEGSAEDAYNRAAELEPLDAGLFYSRFFNALIKAGLYQHAETAIRKCISIKPNDPSYYMRLGEVLILLNRLEESVAAFNQAAVTNRPAEAIYYNRLGNLMAERGHYSIAVEAFRKAIETDGTNPFFYLHLADSYLALGLVDLAKEAKLHAENLKR